MHDKDIVSAIRQILVEKLGAERCELWFGANTHISVVGDALIIDAATKFAQDWLRTHYRGQLETAGAHVLGRSPSLEFRVDTSLNAGNRRRANSGSPSGSGKHAASNGHDLPRNIRAKSAGGGMALLTEPPGAALVTVADPMLAATGATLECFEGDRSSPAGQVSFQWPSGGAADNSAASVRDARQIRRWLRQSIGAGLCQDDRRAARLFNPADVFRSRRMRQDASLGRHLDRGADGPPRREHCLFVG